MKKLSIIILAMLTSIVCMAKKDKVEPGSFKDWCGEIDKVNITEVVKTAQYKTLYILPVDESKVVWPEESDNQYPALKAALANYQEIMRKKLQKEFKELNVVIADDNVELQEGDLALKITIESINMGSRALRFWIGFGAGAQGVEISGSVKNAEKELFNYTHKRYSAKFTTYQQTLESEFDTLTGDLAFILEKMNKAK